MTAQGVQIQAMDSATPQNRNATRILHAGLAVLLLLALFASGCSTTHVTRVRDQGYQGGRVAESQQTQTHSLRRSISKEVRSSNLVDQDAHEIKQQVAQTTPAPRSARAVQERDTLKTVASQQAPAPLTMHFKTGSAGTADLDDQDRARLAKIARFLRQNPATQLRIEGHTDSVGAADSNLELSKERAAKVRQIIVSEYGIAPARLQVTGYGESQPVADNATEEGRARNRRVMAVLLDAQGLALTPQTAPQSAPQTPRQTAAQSPSQSAPQSLSPQVARDVAAIRQDLVASQKQHSFDADILLQKQIQKQVRNPGQAAMRAAVSGLRKQALEARQLAQAPQYEIEISVTRRRLWLFENSPQLGKKLVRSYVIGLPRAGEHMPRGRGEVTRIELERPSRSMARNMSVASRDRSRIGTRPYRALEPGAGSPFGRASLQLSHSPGFSITGGDPDTYSHADRNSIRMRAQEGLELAMAIAPGTKVTVLR